MAWVGGDRLDLPRTGDAGRTSGFADGAADAGARIVVQPRLQRLRRPAAGVAEGVDGGQPRPFGALRIEAGRHQRIEGARRHVGVFGAEMGPHRGDSGGRDGRIRGGQEGDAGVEGPRRCQAFEDAEEGRLAARIGGGERLEDEALGARPGDGQAGDGRLARNGRAVDDVVQQGRDGWCRPAGERHGQTRDWAAGRGSPGGRLVRMIVHEVT